MKKKFFGKILFLVLAVFMMIACNDKSKTASRIGSDNLIQPVIIPAAYKEFTISTSGMKFSPDTINVNVGDKIIFVVGPTHSVSRVDEATWNANKSGPTQGFHFGEGTSTYTIQSSDVGTIYYVCPPHAHLKMKGKIVVGSVSSSKGTL